MKTVCIIPVQCSRTGWKWRKVHRRLLSSAAVLLVCMPADRKAIVFFLLCCFHRSFLTDWGGEGERVPASLYYQQWRFFMYASGSRGRVRGAFFPFKFRPFNFTDWMGGKERGAGEFYSQRRHFWYAFQWVRSSSVRCKCFISTFARLVLTCLVGKAGKAGKAVTGLFALSDDAFGMHVSGSESERAGLYFLASFPCLFLWAGWRGKRGASGLYSQRKQHFSHAGQRVGKASVRDISNK